MNKSYEDTWFKILNMDEPGIELNIVNPTFYLQFLPIPELIPFRLTRQLRNLMMPLQVHGLMESTMIHTLRALRNNCDLLLNTMDIFVKEPSVDWMVSTHTCNTELFRLCLKDMIVLCIYHSVSYVLCE